MLNLLLPSLAPSPPLTPSLAAAVTVEGTGGMLGEGVISKEITEAGGEIVFG